MVVDRKCFSLEPCGGGSLSQSTKSGMSVSSGKAGNNFPEGNRRHDNANEKTSRAQDRANLLGHGPEVAHAIQTAEIGEDKIEPFGREAIKRFKGRVPELRLRETSLRFRARLLDHTWRKIIPCDTKSLLEKMDHVDSCPTIHIENGSATGEKMFYLRINAVAESSSDGVFKLCIKHFSDGIKGTENFVIENRRRQWDPL